MTEDQGEEDVLAVVRTVPGNHARNHYSQRQIDVIKEEIIPQYVTDPKETGIIVLYKNQVKALEREFKDIDAATVHKFQGKEKDTIDFGQTAGERKKKLQRSWTNSYALQEMAMVSKDYEYELLV